MIAYYNGSYLPQDEITISPDDRGFLLADGLYEVIRSYDGTLFQAEVHLQRLNNGARHLKLSQTDFRDLLHVANQLLVKNGLDKGDATVYLQVTRGAAKRRHAFPDTNTPLTLYATASPFNSSAGKKAWEHGARVISVADQRWARCDLKTIALTANVLANQAAHEAGADEAIFVRDGVLIEGSHTNFMCVYDDVVITAPASNYILDGITRKVVLEICKEQGIQTEQRPIFKDQIHLADEAMIVGTTTEVTPVIQIDDLVIGDGTPGKITKILQEEFSKTTGK